MRVNELAKLAGVEAHVVRYYTQIRLLDPSRDPDNQYREYSNTDVQRLIIILRARTLGFSLRDITSILADADADAGVALCQEVRELIQISLTRKARPSGGSAEVAEPYRIGGNAVK